MKLANINFVSLFLVFFSACLQSHGQVADIDSLLKKPQLKVLDIGNSYTDDATSMLSQLVKASKTNVSDMCLYKATKSFGSFKNWYDIYNDTCNGSYNISKVLGGIKANIRTGKGEAMDGSLFREALTNESWDLIIVHHYSSYAPYYDLWQGDGAGGYLNELLAIIKEHQPNAKIGCLLIHSYSDRNMNNKEKSSYERWKLIANSVKRLCEDYPIDLVIPYGTAIENLRSSSLNNDYDLTRDGTHCGLGLARYTASCCYYEALLAPRSGKTILGNPLRYTASQSSSSNHAVDVTDDNALLAQIAAVLAVKKPYSCISPEDSVYTLQQDEDSVLSISFNKYLLTYVVDGDTIGSDSIAYGSAITPMVAPSKEGYEFEGWSDCPEEMPSSDVVVSGSYKLLPQPVMGDADGDNNVSVSDVMMVVGYVVDACPKGFHFDNADIDKDNDITVADIMQIVSIICGTDTQTVHDEP